MAHHFLLCPFWFLLITTTLCECQFSLVQSLSGVLALGIPILEIVIAEEVHHLRGCSWVVIFSFDEVILELLFAAEVRRVA